MIRRIISLIVPVLLGIQSTFAQLDYGFDFSKAGTAGFQFLKIGVGAREAALGEAVTSLTNNANAVFWNPGALPLIRQRQIYFTHNEWIAGSTHDAVALAVPVGSFVFGLSAASLAIEEFEETTVLEPEGTGRMVSAGNLLLGIAAARRFTDRLTVGVQMKYVHENLDEQSFDNMLFDVGALYYTGFRQLRLGFSLQHFGADMKILRQSFRMPLLFRLSAADDLISSPNYRLTAAIDLVHPTDNVEWVNAGLELELLSLISLRGGYRYNVDEGKLSFGIGIHPSSVGPVSPAFDYSYVKYGDILGATHRFSIGFGI